MTDLILSSSSISAYLQCHYRYLLANVYRVGGGQSIAAALGTAVHAAVEGFWKDPIRSEAILERTLAAELARVPVLDEDPAAVFSDGLRMLRTYISTVAPTFTPHLIEKTFVITVDDVTVAGTIDAADDDDVHDTKTTSLISKFDALGHTLQLTLYSLGYRVLTGHPPRRLLLDVLPRGGRVAYRQYEVQPEMNELIDVLGIVSQGIGQEDYEPTGATGGACHYCPYKLVCRYAKTD